jgi:hypothetical protein
MNKPVDLYTITKDFVIDIWKLEKDVGLPVYAYNEYVDGDFFKFPKDSGISVGIVFCNSDKEIRVRSIALKSLSVEIGAEHIEASFLKEDKIHASDPQYFQYILSIIAHMATFGSMGWDTHCKFNDYTKKRVKEKIDERRLCAKPAAKTK